MFSTLRHFVEFNKVVEVTLIPMAVETLMVEVMGIATGQNLVMDMAKEQTRFIIPKKFVCPALEQEPKLRKLHLLATFFYNFSFFFNC